MAAVLQLQALSTGYDLGRQFKPISQNLNLEIVPGELVILMGPNGCGKSTLLRSIAGLVPPLSGHIYLEGRDINKLSAKDLAQSLSLVLTERPEVEHLSVYDVVLNGRYPYLGFWANPRAEDRQIIESSMEICGLQGMTKRLMAKLSDGERQRVMIARAIAQSTALIVLDEPTAHLDLPSRIEMLLMLRSLAHKLGKSILLSSHELDLSLAWADTIWLMDKEGGVSAASPEDLVLEGHLERVFAGEMINFDRQTGQFVLQREGGLVLSLQGEGFRYEWTKRALRRLGFSLAQEKSKYHICVLEDTWLLSWAGQCSTHHSISDLTQYLKHLSKS